VLPQATYLVNTQNQEPVAATDISSLFGATSPTVE
jgi:hypothetical protein